MKTRGSSLIELILYTGLLITILTVLYELFAIAGVRKINEVVEDEIYTNANHIVADFSRTITAGTNIVQPVLGASGNTLSLSGGSIVYQLDANNLLVKTENGVTQPLVTDSVTVANIAFTHLGPSIASPTVQVIFTLNGTHAVDGRIKSRTFQTGYTLR